MVRRQSGQVGARHVLLIGPSPAVELCPPALEEVLPCGRTGDAQGRDRHAGSAAIKLANPLAKTFGEPVNGVVVKRRFLLAGIPDASPIVHREGTDVDSPPDALRLCRLQQDVQSHHVGLVLAGYGPKLSRPITQRMLQYHVDERVHAFDGPLHRTVVDGGTLDIFDGVVFRRGWIEHANFVSRLQIGRREGPDQTGSTNQQ